MTAAITIARAVRDVTERHSLEHEIIATQCRIERRGMINRQAPVAGNARGRGTSRRRSKRVGTPRDRSLDIATPTFGWLRTHER